MPLLEAIAAFDKGVFAIFLDTISRAYDFVPNRVVGLSEEEMADEAYWRPLSPFNLLPTIGLVPILPRLWVLVFRSSPLDISPGFDLFLCPFDKVAESKPLFAALVQAVAEAEDLTPHQVWEWIPSLAQTKLEALPRQQDIWKETRMHLLALNASGRSR